LTRRALAAICALTALAIPASATAAPKTPTKQRTPVNALGSLSQLAGKAGCLVDRSQRRAGCQPVRALASPAPLLGSDAVAISPNGRSVYVASSGSDAIAIFSRNARTGKLTQAKGSKGCIASKGANGCATAPGLDGPNSVTVSPDGKNVYATALDTNAVLAFRRNPSTGGLTRSGCVANEAIPGCTAGRGLLGPDVLKVSPDGKNVYVGAFRGSTLAVLVRNASTGALAQPADATGCIAATPTDSCTTALALGAPEGLAISGDGANVYVANPSTQAVGIYTRDPSTGALTQATDGTGCIVSSPLAGCTDGIWLDGADAVAISPDDDSVYLTSLVSNTLTTFDRASNGQLTQKTGTSACVIYVLAVGCSLGRAMNGPEGVAVSPDGANVYAVAIGSFALDTFDRDSTGAIMQKTRRPGCLTSKPAPDCLPGRSLGGASSVVVSPDGKHVYAAASKSNAVTVFKRVTRQREKD
jgi:DNA-binding beta-propeller fold protein YncE